MASALRALTLAILLSALPMTALAAATSSVTLSIQVELIDLDAGDGVAPSILFHPGTTSHVVAQAWHSASGLGDYREAYGSGPFAAVSVGAAATLSGSNARISGSGMASGTLLHAQGTAAGAGEAYSYFASARIPSLEFEVGQAFTLSANTKVLFSATADLEAVTTNGGGGGYVEYALAAASLDVGTPGAGRDGEPRSGDSLTVYAENLFDVVTDPATGAVLYTVSSGQSKSLSGVKILGSFTNATSGDLDGEMTAFAYVTGRSFMGLVPEPGECALLGVGLLVLGWRLRRSPVGR